MYCSTSAGCAQPSWTRRTEFSKSKVTPTTPVEQVNISSANREEVMANLNDLLNQAGQLEV